MTTTLESMERLINDADGKFEEKLKAVQAGHPTNLSAFADRTYNLRQQIAHNASLTNDDHFMELLVNTEKYLSPEYVVRGEIDKKLTALLAGLLKTLLRETVAISSYASRKIQIEMIWQWYHDKEKQILDFSLKRSDELQGITRGTAQAKAAAATTREGSPEKEKAALPETGPSRPGLELSDTSRQMKGYEPGVFGVAPLATKPTKPLTFTDEANREQEIHAISKKMGLFRKRNLAKAEKLRQEIASKRAATPSSSSGSPNEPRIVYKDRQRGTVSEPRPSTTGGMRSAVSGPTPQLHRQSTSDRDPALAKLDAAVVSSQKHWVKRMIQRVEEENDKRVMDDMLNTLAFNQSRIEEESTRRLESEQFASQAGRTCHTIVRRVPRSESMSGDGESVPVAASSRMPSASMSREEYLGMLGKVGYHGGEVSLSPYDAYQPSPVDEKKLQDLLSRVKSPATSGSRLAVEKLKPTHPRNMAGTPSQNIELDVTPSATMRVTPVVPRSDVPLIEQLLPVLREEENTPSLAQMEQVRLVERIRECMGRARTKNGERFHVTRQEIEKAIITPDDRPYDECFKLLPRPSSAFPKNPFASAQDKKGKKKKGAAKKK